MDSVGDIIFILVGTPIALIVGYYLLAKYRWRHKTPQDKLVFGPFTLGWIICWAFASVWTDLLLVITFLFVYNGADPTNEITMGLFTLLFFAGAVSSSILRKKIDGKQKIKDDMDSKP